MSADLRERRVQGYESPRPDVQRLVPEDARSILELGCSTGALGAELKRRQGARVVGVEPWPAYARDAEQRLDRVFCGTAEEFLAAPSPPEAPFDCFIAADVLEHTAEPWEILKGVDALLAPGASVIISLPNVLYWPQFKRLIKSGAWPRDDEGIFDRTHLRWFTGNDARSLAQSAGFVVEEFCPIFWDGGRRDRLVTKALMSTPLGRFRPAQHVLRAHKPT